MADNWFSDVMQGVGRGARQFGEGLFNAFAPERENANPTGMTPELFAQMQRGEQVTLPPRPGVVEQIANMSGAVNAWKAADEVDQGGREGNEALGNALFAMATLPFARGGLKGKGNALAAPIRAYHGSPHSFDRFDASKIGTGEGAQSYGHGLYFAENEGVARSYRDALSPQWQHHGGWDLSGTSKGAQDLLKAHPDIDSAIAEAATWLGPRLGHIQGELKEIKARGQGPPPGHMYEVGIHADPAKFLDWDKPLSAQSGDVQGVLKDAWLAHPDAHANQRGRQIYDAIAQDVAMTRRGPPMDYPGAAKTFSEAGIPGIRYLDGGSRTAGEGSRNFVIFPGNEHLIEIVRKYGLIPVTAAGAVIGAGALPQQDERAM